MTKELFLKILKDGLSDFPEAILADILYDYKERFDIGLSSGKTEEEIVFELGNPHTIISEYRNGHLQKCESEIVDDSNTENTAKIFDSNTVNFNTVDNFDYSFNDTDYSKTDDSDYKKTNDTDYINTTKTNYKQVNDTTSSRNTSNLIVSILIALISLFLFGPFIFAIVVAIVSVGLALFVSSFAISLSGIALLIAKLAINTVGFTPIPAVIMDFPNSVIILTTLGFILLFSFSAISLYYLIKASVKLTMKFLRFICRKFKGV